MLIYKKQKSVWIQDTSVYMRGQNMQNKSEVYRTRSYLGTAKAIRSGIVKDVHCVASAAACGIAQASMEFEGENFDDFKAHIFKAAKFFKLSKPEIRELTTAIDFVLEKMFKDSSVANSKMRAFEAATEFADRYLM